MRKYNHRLEQDIRTEQVVREWTASGLIDGSQRDRMLAGLQIDVRRTNIYLRLVLLGFTMMIIGASLLFVGVSMNLDSTGDRVLCIVGTLFCIGLAEYLTTQFRLYRFGIEEAASVATIVLFLIAVLFLTEPLSTGWSRHVSQAIAAAAASAAGLYIYGRFGYIYAVILSLLFAAAIPFQFDISVAVQRSIAATILAAAFLVFRFLSHEYDELPADEYRSIQSAAWVGIYLILNLKLTERPLLFLVDQAQESTFYWFTYGAIWVLPALGLYLALRDKDRLLLDVNVAMALATLMTNKPYLHGVRQTWDPILLGILLIAVAVVVRRWLAKGADGMHYGFTAVRLLDSEKKRLSALGTASAAFQGAVVNHTTAPAPAPKPETFQGGGGRSGGAGASGSF